jgi:uroporphyrinogen III methyltransferase/synthase
VNGADAFFNALRQAGLDTRALSRSRVAAIGPATAAGLERYGIRADVQPGKFTTPALASALASADDLKGRRILCPRSDMAPPQLTDALREHGAMVTEVVAYRTVPDDASPSRVNEMLLRGEIHWLTFMSASAVQHFRSAIQPEALTALCPKIASIGPATSDALRKLGLEPTVEADEHTMRGLLDAILNSETSA